MPKYRVRHPFHTFVEHIVIADSEDEAEEISEALLGADEEAEDIQIHGNLIENGDAEVFEAEDEE